MNIKKILKRSLLIALTATFIIGNVALADSWITYYPIYFTDNTSTTREYYPVVIGVSGQTLVDSNDIDSDGLNTDMKYNTVSSEYMMSTTNITAILPSLPASGTALLRLYTGYSPDQTNFPIIVGDGGYGTITDHASIELADNFTITFNGYIDTTSGASKYILQKTDAIEIYVDNTTSGKIIASMLGFTEQLLPTGAGDATQLNPSAGANWDCVNENYATPNDANYVYDNPVAWQYDYYQLADPSFSSNATVNTVTSYIRCDGNPSANLEARAVIRLSGANTLGTVRLSTGAFATYSEVLAKPGGGDWTTTDIQDLQGGCAVRNTTTGIDVTVSQISDVIAYELSVNATGVSSGEHEISVSANTTHFWIAIDGSTEGIIELLNGESVVNNASNYVCFQNESMPYADNMTITIDGTQQAWYEPNTMLTGGTVPDRTNSNDMVITFGTNTGVEIHYGEPESYEDTEASEIIEVGMVVDPVPMPEHWYNTTSDISGVPMYAFMSQQATAIGMDVRKLYGIIIFGISILAFLVTSVLTKHAILGMIALVVVWLAGGMAGILSLWLVFVIILVFVSIAYLYKKVGTQ